MEELELYFQQQSRIARFVMEKLKTAQRIKIIEITFHLLVDHILLGLKPTFSECVTAGRGIHEKRLVVYGTNKFWEPLTYTIDTQTITSIRHKSHVTPAHFMWFTQFSLYNSIGTNTITS
ncbi:hypothetical protein NQ318_011307 [Aromia moschata]|uniref:Uncharacterized protein n=1 Tax=Aromia moschata TaxID=1265417 RepID=A0AAV8XW27_9CUCU|nr:hypothetical protein NQ318_011307 [Aromia moschata]